MALMPTARQNAQAMKRKHDRVVVVGGGPVGSVAALTLALEGIPVTVLEREPAPIIDYRASTFHPPTLDLLEACGATEALLAMGLKAPTMQYRDRQRGRIAEFDFSLLGNDTRHPYRLQCEQFKLVDWTHRRLAAIPGAQLLFSHAVADVRPSEVFFADTYDRIGPLGAKSQGECAINPVAPAIANAVANATGVRFAHLPLTTDRIFAALSPPP